MKRGRTADGFKFALCRQDFRAIKASFDETGVSYAALSLVS